MLCKNCGKELNDNSKFCNYCGTAIENKETTGRNEMYNGTIHKCPNCGDILDGFEVVCSACGYEVRNANAVASIKEFSEKLGSMSNYYQKAEIIKNFPIPNTKEDITEFLILASSNINGNLHKEEFNAWISKIEQCYQKAKISFNQDNEIGKIQDIYQETQKSIRKIRIKRFFKTFLPTMIFLIIFITIIVIVCSKIAGFWTKMTTPDVEAQEAEVSRLETIEKDVEKAINDKEYELAMMHAKSIDYSAWQANDELERQWDIKREYLIQKVIKEAEKDGVKIEYPSDIPVEKDDEKDDNLGIKIGIGIAIAIGVLVILMSLGGKHKAV